MYIKNILKNKQNNKRKKNKPQNKTDKQGEGGCRGTMIDPPPNQKIQTQRENKRTLSLIQAVFPLFSSNNDLWE